MRSIYLCTRPDILAAVYGERARARVTRLTECLGAVAGPEEYRAPRARDAEVAFSTWGMPALSEEELDFFPSLRAVFYAAGSVQSFARPLLARGIRLFSARQANAVPVAEFAFSQILLALKGYFPISRMDRAAGIALMPSYPGSYGSRAGLIGFGTIARKVAALLANTDVEVMVYDPFLSPEEAGRLGVQKAELEEIFSQCDVISNHLPDLPATRGILRRELLMGMKPCATFINTARAAQLREEDLYDALAAVPTRTALLDVMWDESPTARSRLSDLPNCFLSPHMAGAVGPERLRLGESMVDEFERFQKGEVCPFEVTAEMLENMA